MKTIIRLTENAHLESGFYRMRTEDGEASVYAMDGSWYQAYAEDGDGNEYLVIWAISDREAFENGDEDCCNWNAPYYVEMDSKDVTEKVILE